MLEFREKRLSDIPTLSYDFVPVISHAFSGYGLDLAHENCEFREN
jgi:hypothetical protein